MRNGSVLVCSIKHAGHAAQLCEDKKYPEKLKIQLLAY